MHPVDTERNSKHEFTTDEKIIKFFIEWYLDHPFWTAAKLNDPEDKWFRVVFMRSKTFDLIQKKYKTPAIDFTRVFEEVYTGEEIHKFLHDAQKYNERGYLNCYIVPNIAPKNIPGNWVTDKDITNNLVWCVDDSKLQPNEVRERLEELGLFTCSWIETSPGKFQGMVGVPLEKNRDEKFYEDVALRLRTLLKTDTTLNESRLMRMPGTINWNKPKNGCSKLISVVESPDVAPSLEAFKKLQKTVKKSPKNTGEGTRDNAPRLFSLGWQEAMEKLGAYEAGSYNGSDPKIARRGERNNALISWAGGLANSVVGGRLSEKEAESVLLTLAMKACEGNYIEEDGDRSFENILKHFKSCIGQDKERLRVEREKSLESVEELTGGDIEGLLRRKAQGIREGKDATRETVETRKANSTSMAVQSNGGRNGKNVADGKEVEAFPTKSRIQQSQLWGTRIEDCGGTRTISEEHEVNRLHNNGLNNNPIQKAEGAVDTTVSRRGEGEQPLTAFNHTNVIEYVGKYVSEFRPEYENEEEYLRFLFEYMVFFASFKKEDGDSLDLVNLLIGRTEKLRLLDIDGLSVPTRLKSRWGTIVEKRIPLDAGQVDSYFNILVMNLKRRVFERRKDIQALPEMQEVIEALREGAEEEATDYNEDGEPIVNLKKANKVEKEKRKKLFKMELKGSLKGSLVRELVACVVAWSSNNPGEVGDERQRVVVFQNGEYLVDQMGKGESGWRRGDWYRRETVHVLDTNFNEDVAKAFVKKLGKRLRQEEIDWTSGKGRRGVVGEYGLMLKEFLGENCPRFGRFLEDTFPSDYSTWISLLGLMGYGFIPSNPFQVAAALCGISGSGKGVTAEIFAGAVGTTNAAVLDYKYLSKENEGTSVMVGKLVSLADEAEVADKRTHNENFSVLKRITGGYDVRVRSIYGSAKKATVYSLIMIMSNEPLEYDETQGAGARRVLTYWYDEPARKRVPGLSREILKDEGDIVSTLAVMTLALRWAMGTGAFRVPGSISLATGSAETTQATDPLSYLFNQVVVKDIATGGYAEGVIPWDLLKAIFAVYLEAVGDDARAAHKEVTGHKLGRHISSLLKLHGSEFDKDDKWRVGDKKIRVVRGFKIDWPTLWEHVDIGSVFDLCNDTNILVIRKLSQDDFIHDTFKNIPENTEELLIKYIK